MARGQELQLGAEFPAPTHEQWLALVDKVLKGRSFDAELVSRTYDGLAVQPLYTPSDVTDDDPGGLAGLHPFTRGSRAAGHTDGGWDVRQVYAGPGASGDDVTSALDATNQAILGDLEAGATSLALWIGPSDLPVRSPDDLDRLLAGVRLDLAPVVLDADDGPATARLLVELWGRREVPETAALAQLGIDPLARAARRGVEASVADLVGAFELAENHPLVRPGRVDTTVYADAGASAAQELAFGLATFVEYLRGLTGAGIDVDRACQGLVFQVATDVDQFLSLAKLRAARRIWARVAEASGAAPHARAPRLDAVTSAAMLASRDPWVNLLRATLATFAAGAGGADSITVLPFDWAVGVPDETGRRLARATQLILLEESHLAHVVDPGGGSYYVERLTEELSQEAWRRFQEVESRGGMAAALESGWAREAVEATWAARLTNLARRRDPLTGVSEFPDIDERPLGRRPWPDGARARTTASPFPLRRRAEPFERLRRAAEQAPEPPRVFLANLGPVATHTARAAFAKNLFEAGGIRAVGNDGFDSPAAAARAFRDSGAGLAVICSSDEEYAASAETTARALKEAGAACVYLAGQPGERRNAYEAAGVDGYVHVGCDVVETLTSALAATGVQA